MDQFRGNTSGTFAAMCRDKTAPAETAYLMKFDRRDTSKRRSLDKRIYWQEESLPAGKAALVGCR